MKASSLVWSLVSLLTTHTLAASPDLKLESTSNTKSPITDPDSVPSTFNGIEVPPIPLLTPDNYEEMLKDGYWFVKHYSPVCPHCKSIAPAWQTLYEFYYTSDPLATTTSKSTNAQSSMNSFTNFYDFHFASMNCLAYADLCAKLGVQFYPTFSLYQKGNLLEQYADKKSMEGLSHFIEEKLELIRPGSRPSKGVKLPEPGASNVDTKADPDNPVAKDKDVEAGIKAGEKHNEQVAQKSNKGGETTDIPKTKTPTAIANLQGTSIPLTAEKFQQLVTRTRDPWFIKFYAPWCHHCQSLAPNWLQMAKEMKGVLNIGEVNCEIETRLCKDARVQGYPTMYYFRGGERVEYDGLRGLGDLISFARKAVEIGAGVQDVSAAAFKELEGKEEVVFLYLYDHATTSEDFAALERLTLNLVGHARIVKSDSAALAERFKISTWPRLLVVRDGRPSYFNVLAPRDMRDIPQILSWMQSVWLPIVPELTASNAKEVMEGKYVVLGVLSHKRPDEFILAKRELKNAAMEWMDKQTQLFHLERQELRDAKQLRIEEAEDRDDQRALRSAKSMRITIREDDKKQVAFAWVDGDFWERWLRTTYGINVKEGERVIINDEENRRYWDTAASGSPILPSRTSILETIPLVISNSSKLKSRSTVGFFEAVIFHTKWFIINHPIFSLVFLVILAISASITFRKRNARRAGPGGAGILGISNGSSGGSGGFFKLDGKEGLLSGGSAGKVD